LELIIRVFRIEIQISSLIKYYLIYIYTCEFSELNGFPPNTLTLSFVSFFPAKSLNNVDFPFLKNKMHIYIRKYKEILKSKF